MKRIHIRVYGDVHGVFFRAFVSFFVFLSKIMWRTRSS